MNRALLAVVSVLALAVAPASAGENGPEAARPPRSKERAMDRLDDAALQRCLERNGAVALVRVKAAWIDAEGTRSEHGMVALTLVRALHGAVPPEFEARADGLPAVGLRYVVCLRPLKGWASYFMDARHEVPPGDEAAAVERHARALAALQGK